MPAAASGSTPKVWLECICLSTGCQRVEDDRPVKPECRQECGRSVAQTSAAPELVPPGDKGVADAVMPAELVDIYQRPEQSHPNGGGREVQANHPAAAMPPVR